LELIGGSLLTAPSVQLPQRLLEAHHRLPGRAALPQGEVLTLRALHADQCLAQGRVLHGGTEMLLHPEEALLFVELASPPSASSTASP